MTGWWMSWTQVLWIWTSGAGPSDTNSSRLGVHHAVVLPQCAVGNYTTRQQEEDELAYAPSRSASVDLRPSTRSLQSRDPHPMQLSAASRNGENPCPIRSSPCR